MPIMGAMPARTGSMNRDDGDEDTADVLVWGRVRRQQWCLIRLFLMPVCGCVCVYVQGESRGC